MRISDWSSDVCSSDLLAVQIVVTMAGPAGREVKISMPTRATPSNDRPTQMPLPRKKKRTARKTPIRRRSFTGGGSRSSSVLLQLGRVAFDRRPAGDPDQQFDHPPRQPRTEERRVGHGGSRTS